MRSCLCVCLLVCPSAAMHSALSVQLARRQCLDALQCGCLSVHLSVSLVVLSQGWRVAVRTCQAL